MNWRQILPFCCTLGALVAGVFSILESASGEFVMAAQLIMLSMMLDGLDGALARWLKGSTQFGAELDTFVDMISFGVAPAVLVHQAVLKEFHIWGPLMVALIVASGAMRLARFRVVDPYRGQHGYLGLPITVSAGWMTLFVFVEKSGVFDWEFFSLSSGPLAAFVWTCALVMLVLQVSHVRYSKPTKEPMIVVAFALLIVFLFLKVPVAATSALAMCTYGFVFAFISPFLARHAVVDEAEEDEPVSLRHS